MRVQAAANSSAKYKQEGGQTIRVLQSDAKGNSTGIVVQDSTK
jgi:hypothetical protein